MPFPDSSRVVYSKNPLVEVICQLRFSPILRIDTELPAKFQDRIREEYSEFAEEFDTASEIPAEILRELPPELRRVIGVGGVNKRAYKFTDADGKWAVGLTREFLALTSTGYTRWEDFFNHLKQPLNAFVDEYKPSSFSRVGLRYRNIIRRSELGLSGTPWSALLKPHIAGVLSTGDFRDSEVTNSAHLVEVKLPNNIGNLAIRHGTIIDDIKKETCYLIDNDFYVEKVKGRTDAINRLNEFNAQSRRLFRWCITDELHRAMGPEPTVG